MFYFNYDRLNNRDKNIEQLNILLADKERELWETKQYIRHLEDLLIIVSDRAKKPLFEQDWYFANYFEKFLIIIWSIPYSFVEGTKTVFSKGPREFAGKLSTKAVFIYHYLTKRFDYTYLDYNQQYQLFLKTRPSLRNQKKASKKKEFHFQPKISIIMPVYNAHGKWLDSAIDSVRKQIYENWELCIVDNGSKEKQTKAILKKWQRKDKRIKIAFLERNYGIAGANNKAIEFAKGELVGFLDDDDKLTPDALFEAIKCLNEHPKADLIYSDEDKISEDDKYCDPFFKPDWSPDMILSCNYINHFSVFRKSLLLKIGAFREGFEGSQDYDLVLRFTEMTDQIYHIPSVLYHWRKTPGSTAYELRSKTYATEAAKKALTEALERRKIEGKVEDGLSLGTYRAKRRIYGNPLVSIIIPFKDEVNLLKNCIASIENRTLYPNYEIVLVNNESQRKETYEYLEDLPYTKIFYQGDFNFSKINNYATKYAKGDYLLFLNNDIEVISPEWLGALLEHGQREEVGAVGCKLLYPDYTMQHVGLVTGVLDVAAHSHKGLPDYMQGYFSLPHIIRNCSALTGACLLTRKDVFDQVGGFDEKNFAVAFNDVDFCLRLRDKGYLIVYTPFAKMYHYESRTRGYDLDIEEIVRIKQKWEGRLSGDPYYNVNLTTEKEDYSLRLWSC